MSHFPPQPCSRCGPPTTTGPRGRSAPPRPDPPFGAGRPPLSFGGVNAAAPRGGRTLDPPEGGRRPPAAGGRGGGVPRRVRLLQPDREPVDPARHPGRLVPEVDARPRVRPVEQGAGDATAPLPRP